MVNGRFYHKGGALSIDFGIDFGGLTKPLFYAILRTEIALCKSKRKGGGTDAGGDPEFGRPQPPRRLCLSEGGGGGGPHPELFDLQ